MNMETAKLFFSGNSQAVRLPKEYRFDGDEVLIKKCGNTIMLFPKEQAWETFLDGLDGFSDDFLADDRNQGIQRTREIL